MSFLILTVLAVGLAVDFVRDKNLISPIKIFNGVWLVIFTLYQLMLSDIQQELSLRTLFIFLTCIVCFDLTYFIAAAFKKEIKSKKIKKHIAHNKPTGINITKLVHDNLKRINIGFILVFIVEILYSGGFPLAFRLAGGSSDYLSFGIPSIHGVMNGLAISLCTYYIVKRKKEALIYIVFAIMTVSRFVIIAILLQTAVVILLRKIKKSQKLNLKKYVFIGTAALILFGIAGNFRSGNDTMAQVFGVNERSKNLPVFVMWPYSYMEFSLSNFNNLVSMTNGGVNYGASSLNFLLPSILLDRLSVKPNWNERYVISPNFNVSTWFPEIYLDFGIIGIAAFSILISYFGFILYNRAINSKNIRDELLYGVYAHNIMLWFFVNMFLYISVVAQFLYIPLLFNDEDDK